MPRFTRADTTIEQRYAGKGAAVLPAHMRTQRPQQSPLPTRIRTAAFGAVVVTGPRFLVHLL
jgi:hypothetical protein